MQTIREGTTVMGAGSTDVAEDLPRAFGTFPKTILVVQNDNATAAICLYFFVCTMRSFLYANKL